MNKLMALMAGAALAAATAGTANAAVFISKLEYRDGAAGVQTPSFGTVTITEVDAFHVRVDVALTSANSLFVNTGGPHDPFLFNVNGAYAVAVDNTLAPGQQFTAEPYTNPA